MVTGWLHQLAASIRVAGGAERALEQRARQLLAWAEADA
jgi:hypothetical protein